MRKKLILVIASTFPASNSDPVPAFVKDQLIALNDAMPNARFSVLAPHNKMSDTKCFTRHEAYDEHRFHYFWPHSLEKLAGRGIVPSLNQNRFRYLLIPFFLLGEYFSLRKLIEKQKPDLLYAHWFTPQAVIASLLSKKFDIPFGYTTHASDVLILKKIPFGSSIVRGVTRQAGFVTAVSNRTTKKLKMFFSDEEWKVELEDKFKIIPMGVAPTSIRENVDHSIKKFGLDSNKKKILFVGRLAEKKGVSYLISAFKLLPIGIKQNCQLIIMGDGPLFEVLKKAAADDSSIIFTGYAHGAEKQDLFQIADLICIPSIVTDDGDSEGFPVVLMEGFQLGKIIIATNESGAEEVIEDGKNGYLIPQKSSKAIADSITKALSLDKIEFEQLVSNSITTGAIYKWSDVAKHYKQFLDSVLLN